MRLPIKQKVMEHHRNSKRRSQRTQDQLAIHQNLAEVGLGSMNALKLSVAICFPSIALFAKKDILQTSGELDVKRDVASISHNKFSKQLETQKQLKSFCHDALATKVIN